MQKENVIKMKPEVPKFQISSKWISRLFLVSLFFIFLIHHWYVLFNTPLLPGPDGGYYAVQVREIIRSGNLYYSAPPIAFFIFAFFAWIFLNINAFPAPLCIINGVKLGLAFMKALCIFPVYLISKQITRNNGISIVNAILFELHPFFMLLTYGTSLFKNAVGVFFLLFYIYFVNRVSIHATRKDLTLAIVFLGLTALTHILDFGLAIAYTLLYVVIDIIRRKRIDMSNHLLRLFLVESAIVGIPFTVIIVFLPVYFGTYYKFESFFEELLIGEENIPSLNVLLSNPLILVSISFSIIAIVTAIKNHIDALTLRVLISSSLITFFLISPQFPPQWHIRFTFMLFIPLMLMLPGVLKRVREVESMLVIILLLFSIFMPGYIHSSRALPVVTPEEIDDLHAMSPYIPKNNTIVLARFGLHYWITWFLDVKSSHYMSELENYVKQYDHVFVVYEKQTHPRIQPQWEILFVGKALILVKIK